MIKAIIMWDTFDWSLTHQPTAVVCEVMEDYPRDLQEFNARFDL